NIIWLVIKPDNYSKMSGLIVGLLFVLNIALEQFIEWKAANSGLISTIIIMALIFLTFAGVSAIKTIKTGSIRGGILASFASSLPATIIALSFGFLIDFVFPQLMIISLKNYPGYEQFGNHLTFVFYNSFDNASNHIVVVPIVS